MPYSFEKSYIVHMDWTYIGVELIEIPSDLSDKRAHVNS